MAGSAELESIVDEQVGGARGCTGRVRNYAFRWLFDSRMSPRMLDREVSLRYCDILYGVIYPRSDIKYAIKPETYESGTGSSDSVRMGERIRLYADTYMRTCKRRPAIIDRRIGTTDRGHEDLLSGSEDVEDGSKVRRGPTLVEDVACTNCVRRGRSRRAHDARIHLDICNARSMCHTRSERATAARTLLLPAAAQTWIPNRPVIYIPRSNPGYVL